MSVYLFPSAPVSMFVSVSACLLVGLIYICLLLVCYLIVKLGNIELFTGRPFLLTDIRSALLVGVTRYIHVVMAV